MFLPINDHDLKLFRITRLRLLSVSQLAVIVVSRWLSFFEFGEVECLHYVYWLSFCFMIDLQYLRLIPGNNAWKQIIFILSVAFKNSHSLDILCSFYCWAGFFGTDTICGIGGFSWNECRSCCLESKKRKLEDDAIVQPFFYSLK